jgi:hypothetical protein
MYKGTGKRINNVVAIWIAMDFISCCVLAVVDVDDDDSAWVVWVQEKEEEREWQSIKA